jgi:hypothetical protein
MTVEKPSMPEFWKKMSVISLKDKEYLNSKETGEILGTSPAAIRNLVLRRKIPFRKPAGRLIFIRTEIEQWIMDSPGVRPEDIR